MTSDSDEDGLTDQIYFHPKLLKTGQIQETMSLNHWVLDNEGQ